MKTLKYIALLFLVLGSGWNCSDVLEEDLQDHQVQLRAPANNLTTDLQTHTFWWEQLDEVINGYRLQIVSPSFDSTIQLIADVTITEGESHEMTLASGTYQWTVFAFNSTSETVPVIYDLVIRNDSSLNLSNQQLALVSPINGMITNKTDLTFLWQSLTNADAYKFQLGQPDFSNSTFLVEETTVNTDSYSTTLEEGAYQWRVRAENDLSVTSYTTYQLTIDLTPPAAPILTSPTSGDTLSLPINLSWTADNDTVMDTLYVYKDSLITAPILQVPTTGTQYQFNDTQFDQYFWQVRSVDAAGNAGAFSVVRKFSVE